MTRMLWVWRRLQTGQHFSTVSPMLFTLICGALAASHVFPGRPGPQSCGRNCDEVFPLFVFGTLSPPRAPWSSC